MKNNHNRESIDLSHVVEHGMITYQGLPAPIICDYLSRAASRERYGEGVEFQIGKIEMVANTGTYVDAPFHRYADGKDLAELPLSSLANLPGVVIRTDSRIIDESFFIDMDLTGCAVIINTNWDRYWRTNRYFENNPHITATAAQYLKEQGVALVGIDSSNIDNIIDLDRPAHSILLAADIPICEHLTGLAQLPNRNFCFFAVPVKVKAFGTFPVRAFALLD